MVRNQSLPMKPLLTRPDHDRKFYGANLAEVFRPSLYDCSLKNVCGVPDFALTRLKGGPMEMRRTPAYPEDRAILICVALALTPVDRWARARIVGQEVSIQPPTTLACRSQIVVPGLLGEMRGTLCAPHSDPSETPDSHHCAKSTPELFVLLQYLKAAL